MSDAPIAPGQTLAGKYRIERVLGTGAMGMVLAATNIGLDARVAIKVMLGGGRNVREQEERFLREARVAAMLKSEHAGKVLDVGTTESGAPYIVMEYLDGQDLASLLEERGPLPVDEAVAYVLQACEAIAEAHALGIVHRDIKPANLFLTKRINGTPCVKVVDFGVAKQLDGGLGLTNTGAALGSPLYMSPEQMNGSRDVDARSDIWALGVTLFQLLAQATPFHAETVMELCTRVYMEQSTPLAQYRPDVPAALATVILQCLEKDPRRRWPNVATFADALARFTSAEHAAFVSRIARVQNVEVAPSRPTTELGAPSDAVLADAMSASPASVSRPEAPAVTLASAEAASRPRSLLVPALVVAAVLLGGGVAAALSFGLTARVEAPTVPIASDAPTSTASTASTTASATAESSATAPPDVTPAAPSVSSASTTHTHTSAPAIPHSLVTAKPSSGVLGGSRR